jgi:hypothetical protein
MENDHTFILVGNMQVGLVGLKGIFEELKNARGVPEPELKTTLIEKAEQKNYIVPTAREAYGKALYREFRKFLGEKAEEQESRYLEVTVIGLGCYTCKKLEEDVMAVLSETGIQAAFSHLSDPRLMAQHGILATPALIINGKVKSAGILPGRSTIKKWLEEEKA